METKPVNGTENTPNPPKQTAQNNQQFSSDRQVRFADQTQQIPHPTRYTTPTYVGSATALDKRPAIKSKADLLEMYPDCFDETVGCFEQFKYHINVDPNAKPVIHAARRVPLELKARLEVELKDLS